MKMILFIALIIVLTSAKKTFFGKCECYGGQQYDEATGKCVDEPALTVENCQQGLYESNKTNYAKCSSCKHLFRLKSETSCLPIESDNQVENCKFQDKKDTCYQCNDNYRPYSNYSKCGALPENCHYLDAIKTSITCNDCVNKYILNGTTCESVPTNDVANCAEWKEKTKCEKCEKLFFLESNNTKCTTQITVENCKLLYNTNKGCNECEWGFSKSSDETTCTKGTIIDCELHESSDKTNCKFCKQGYQLNADKTKCTAFATQPTDFDSNCQTYDSNSKCIQCVYTYQWEVDSDGDGGDYETYPKFAYTTAEQSCSQECEIKLPGPGIDPKLDKQLELQSVHSRYLLHQVEYTYSLLRSYYLPDSSSTESTLLFLQL